MKPIIKQAFRGESSIPKGSLMVTYFHYSLSNSSCYCYVTADNCLRSIGQIFQPPQEESEAKKWKEGRIKRRIRQAKQKSSMMNLLMQKSAFTLTIAWVWNATHTCIRKCVCIQQTLQFSLARSQQEYHHHNNSAM